MAEEIIRYFQYLAGERQGEVLPMKGIVEEDGEVYIEFDDKSRCNEEFILPLNETNYTNQLMAEVSSPDNIWKFDKKWVGRQEEKYSKPEDSETGEVFLVQPFIEGRLQITPIPPKKAHTRFGRITRHVETPEPSKPAPPPEPDYKSDPVYLMLSKSKKFDTEVTIDLLMSLPKKSLYEVIDDSFEDGGAKMVEFIVKELNVEEIKRAIQKSLLENYNGVEEGTELKDSMQNVINHQELQHTEIYKAEPVDPTQSFEPEVIEEPEIGESTAQGEIIQFEDDSEQK